MSHSHQERRAHRLAIGDGILNALEERADRARKAGRWAQARRFVDRVLAFDPGRRSARRLLGHIYLDSGRFREAFDTFRAICDERSDDVWSACRAGEALYHDGELAAAIRWLSYAVELDATADAFSHRRARILLQRVRRQRRSR